MYFGITPCHRATRVSSGPWEAPSTSPTCRTTASSRTSSFAWAIAPSRSGTKARIRTLPSAARPAHFAELTVTPLIGAGPASSQPCDTTGVVKAEAGYARVTTVEVANGTRETAAADSGAGPARSAAELATPPASTTASTGSTEPSLSTTCAPPAPVGRNSSTPTPRRRSAPRSRSRDPTASTRLPRPPRRVRNGEPGPRPAARAFRPAAIAASIRLRCVASSRRRDGSTASRLSSSTLAP